MADLTASLCGLLLKHPVLPGPGPVVAGGAEVAAALHGGAAAAVLQTVALNPSPNPRRTPYGKDGAFHHEPCSARPFGEWLATDYQEALKAARAAGVPFIPSIGYRAAGVANMAIHLRDADALLYDTHHAQREQIHSALEALRSLVSCPVIVRLGPHHGEDLADFAASLEKVADGFCVIGSFGPALLLDSEAPGASPGLGFLSGAPIRPVAQRFVFELARRVSKPVIAAGGIASGRDVAECLLLGATAVMASTQALLKGPGVFGAMAQELDRWLDVNGYGSVAEVQGQYIRKYGRGQRVVTEKEEAPALTPDACITCTFCETVCFYDAIVAPPKRLPAISDEPCFQCGLCVSACPTGALSFRPRDAVTLLPAPKGV
ncbi:MAG TPA: 4Fe-4S binding protein [Symbiobacteriaceae bacterium]|nr:4Fe-4S binding protein [Symbiobacteriaceae bacterium]